MNLLEIFLDEAVPGLITAVERILKDLEARIAALEKPATPQAPPTGGSEVTDATSNASN
jgi:hypothetical protein